MAGTSGSENSNDPWSRQNETSNIVKKKIGKEVQIQNFQKI